MTTLDVERPRAADSVESPTHALQPASSHRHAAAARRALHRVQLLSDPAFTSDPAWTHHGSRWGVSIYSRIGLPEVDPALHEGAPGEPELHESLPCFLGSGWLPGADWRIPDLIATVSNLGARAVWDQSRFRGDSSKIVQVLSTTDQLAHVFVRGTDLVGERDSSQVITSVLDPDHPDLGYVASCSVVDPLIPAATGVTRAHLNVAGWRLERLDCAPRTPSPPLCASPEPARRLLMPRTTSLGAVRMLSADPTRAVERSRTAPETAYHDLPLEPLPPRHTRSGISPGPTSRRSSLFTTIADPVVAPDLGREGPGVMLSYTLLTTPHGTIPTSFTNRLTQAAPLCIATLIRYLHRYGFAPHFDHTDREHVDILVERFEPLHGAFHLLFRRRPSQHYDTTTRIRFHGASFGNGRFDVTVERAKSWVVEHDHAPTLEDGGSAISGEGELMCSMPPPGRPRIFQRFSSAYVPRTGAVNPRPSSSSAAPPSSADEFDDASIRPGSRGGCTLVIRHHDSPIPVEVRIEQRPERAGIKSQAIVDRGAAFSAIAQRAEQPPTHRHHSPREHAIKSLDMAKSALRLLKHHAAS